MNKIDIKKMGEPPQALKDAYDRLSPEDQRLYGLFGLGFCLSADHLPSMKKGKRK